jgi:hypothetical protein
MLNITSPEQEEENSFVELTLTDPSELITKRKSVGNFNAYEGQRIRMATGTEEEISEAIRRLETDADVTDARLYAIALKLDGFYHESN